jgi:hypothetical protein
MDLILCEGANPDIGVTTLRFHCSLTVCGAFNLTEA